MNRLSLKQLSQAIGLEWRVGMIVLLSITVGLGADPGLTWNKDKTRVDARLEGWDLNRVLENVATKTGWQIMVEPNMKRSISVKFKDLPVSEALKLILGDLSYALTPQSNAPAKLFVFRNSAQDATELIEPGKEAGAGAKNGGLIANELLVTMKAGSKESIDELAKRLGAKIIGRADNLRTYRLQFEDANAANTARTSLASDPEVDSVSSNYVMAAPDRTDAVLLSSGTPSLNLTPSASTKGIVVGLVDTAVQVKASGLENIMLPSISVTGDGQSSADQLTHGTSMAELLGQAIAKLGDDSTSVQLLPVNVYNGSSDSTTTYEVALGIQAAYEEGAKIINLSLAGGDSQFLSQVTQAVADKGTLLVASAGNTPDTNPLYPASYSWVISVTAGGASGIASYANRAASVDVMVSGTGIVTFGNNTYLVTGTSVSAASLSGLLAGYMDQTGKSATAAKDAIIKTFAYTGSTKK